MRIVCACLNSKFIHSSLAVWCLRAGVKQFCKNETDIEIIEDTINSDNKKLIEKIKNTKPDLVSFSCYIWNITKTLELCHTIKSFSDCRIVLGGPEVSYRAAEILEKYDYIDFVLTGEGEWCFSALINAIDSCTDFSLVEGLTYRFNNTIVSNPSVEHSETPPSPYCDEYFKNLSGRIAYIETSRGCPFRCAYCLSGRVSSLRFFDITQVKNDILKLAKSGTKTVKFIDRTFNASSSHANEILNFIKENFTNSSEENICFHFEIAADILKESTLKILSEMPQGLIQLEIGIQSFNEKTLKHINRKSNIEVLTNNIKKLISLNNMHIHIDLIAGLSYEDLNSFITGFNKAYYLKADMLQLGFLKMLYGSDMRSSQNIYPCEFSEMPPYEVISTPWISKDELIELKYCESALDRLYNSGRFLITLDYLIGEIGISPYSLFNEFGKSHDFNNMSLFDFTKCVYEHFSKFSDPEILREKICCDLISSAVNSKLPDELKIYSPIYKQTKKFYTENFGSNIKLVILNSCNKVYVVSDKLKKNLKGRYEGLYFDL